MGLSCVPTGSESLCVPVTEQTGLSSSVLPGGERAGDGQGKLVNLKKMTVWFVKRDLTE